MVAEIVISANFSDASSRILAGASEDSLQETSLVVSDVRSQPINAVKALAVVETLADQVEDMRRGLRGFRRIGLELEGAALGLDNDNRTGAA